MSARELEIKVECGSVIKELDPSVPAHVQAKLDESEKVYRYRLTTISSETATGVKRKFDKVENADADEATLRPPYPTPKHITRVHCPAHISA